MRRNVQLTRFILVVSILQTLIPHQFASSAAAASAGDDSTTPSLLSQLCVTSIRDYVHDSCVDCLPGGDRTSIATNSRNCCNNDLLRTCFERLQAQADYVLAALDEDDDDVDESKPEGGIEEEDDVELIFPPAQKRAKFRFGKRGRNTFLGKRTASSNDASDGTYVAEKRSRNTFLGKRGGELVETLKRARNTFLGKRFQLPEADFDKRSRNTFLGRRSQVDPEKRSRNKFLGKRDAAVDKKSRNVFLGKRVSEWSADDIDDDAVAKRSRNTFLGKRVAEDPPSAAAAAAAFDSDDAVHDVVERSRNKFLGKRDDAMHEEIAATAAAADDVPRIDRIGHVTNVKEIEERNHHVEGDMEKRARNTFLGR
jgi:hypothetical protein